MGQRTLKDKNIRKLTETGNNESISVTLPIEMIRQLEWREKQKVVISKKGKSLIIKDWKK